ncbi:hypothetical protein DL768_007866 [Monosporascus sp. mg162]|nr:hypothetical protein DL768_007866 [Monosporascus sp. mg162]
MQGPCQGEYLRADHLIKGVLESRLTRGAKGPSKDSPKLDESTISEYNDILAKIDDYSGSELGDFDQTAGYPESRRAAAPIYLRPNTTQGQFINFKKLLNYNQSSMPFASANIGKSYRNEISPKSGRLRVRKFLMAEIEHYVDPKKKYPRFVEVGEIELPLIGRRRLPARQRRRPMIVGRAVKSKIIENETLGYIVARIMLFLLNVRVDSSKLRFKQYMANEMAHHACGCWDAELLTSYGWIECVGCTLR